ncbi:MAG TPA: DNA polymerase III subunit alpha [Gammaproteobacteria bacterium]|nr:DNA polymerase III subunit alpha [Gammaproteobacteria bacterium]
MSRVSPNFVHLRVHSEYSLIDSVVRVRPLAQKAGELGMAALALTDAGNVSGLVKFHRAAIDAGVKPIIGADVFVEAELGARSPSRLCILCLNEAGYRQLSRLLTRAHAGEHDHSRSLIRREWLEPEALDQLIAISGAEAGAIGQALERQTDDADRLAAEYAALFPGRFYVELNRLGRASEAAYIGQAVRLAARHRLPVVATNDVRFVKAEEFDAHETRVCIASGRTLGDADRPRDYTEEQYLKSAEEMVELFGDLPEALENSVEIARRCNFMLETDAVHMPQFEVPAGSTAEALLRERSAAGLAARMARQALSPAAGGPVAAGDRETYEPRLAAELDVICRMGFEGYFLIVADFIAWARDNGIPVGPGRGSGAGSLVAYSLGITDLDPIEHDLLFERFLNPERVSMPDFDIDFCIEGRDRVIDYVSRRYGRDKVSQIITFGTMAAKAVVRDVGRVLGYPYGYVDRIAKLIPFELGITLDKALDDDEELKGLYETEEEVRSLLDLARELEGLARNAGTHAGGVVIAPRDLTEFMPLYSDPESASLTQLDKDDLETIGLVKFDFLGLKTLTIIDKAVRAINREREALGEPPVDIGALPVDDEKTYALLRSCETTAVFQLESRGMRDLIKRIQPDRFGDLVAIVALFRPGPMHMADDFISRKQGKERIDYLHPKLEPILKPTYGVILYQEQVMQVAQELAGYSLGGADLLRRAMGKKKPEEMAEQRQVFLDGAEARGVEPGRAAYIFDLMEKFAGYGFNKSHSAAYALLAYQTAWLKAHYPEAFMAAVMTADMDNTDKLVILKDDCKRLGIAIAPPTVNASSFGFTVGGPKRIVYGLGAIKGVGRSVVDHLVAERERSGPYRDLSDLCRRIDSNRIGRRVLEALTCAGALDDLGRNRPTLLGAIEASLRLAESAAQAEAAGQGALFGGALSLGELSVVVSDEPDWTRRQRLRRERESLGLYLTGHPFEEYERDWNQLGQGCIAKVVGARPEPAPQERFSARFDVVVAGVVMDLRRRGNRVSVVLDDDTDQVEVTVFDELYAACRHLLAKDQVLVVDGQLRFDDFLGAWRVTAKSIRSVDDAIAEYARRITITLTENVDAKLIDQLRDALEPHRNGSCEVSIRYSSPVGEAQLVCGGDWTVRPTRELLDDLSLLLGDGCYRIHCPPPLT